MIRSPLPHGFKALFAFSATLSAGGLSLLSAEMPEPLLEFLFNDRNIRYSPTAALGSGALSTGTVSATLGFGNSLGGFPRGTGDTRAILSSSFYLPQASGISGQNIDLAFIMDTAPGDMGNAIGDGATSQALARTGGPLPELGGLSSITLSGWFRAGDLPISNFTRLLTNWGEDAGFEIRHGPPHLNPPGGTIELRINNQAVSSPTAAYADTNTWVFFAISYDSTTNEARFFRGTRTSPVVQIGNTATLSAGPVAASNRPFTVGNLAGGGQRAFEGQFDNLRVHGTASGSVGALPLAQLESLRQSDLEGSTFAPNPPTNLTTEVLSSTEVQLRWTDNASDETGFRVERRPVDGTWTTVTELAPNTTLYLDTSAPAGSHLEYAIRTVRDGAVSPPATANATTPAIVTSLDRPGPLRFNYPNAGEIAARWTDTNTAEAGYVVEFRLSEEGAWQEAAVLPANRETALIRPGVSNADVWVRVFAFNGDLTSPPREDLARIPDRRSFVRIEGVGDTLDLRTVTRTLYVSPDGNNQNTGESPEAAFRNINTAITRAGQFNQAGEGTRIIILPGRYLEGNNPNADVRTGAAINMGIGLFGPTPKPIILEGAGWTPGTNTGDVIITGSEVVSGWSWDEATASYVLDWPEGWEDWGISPIAYQGAPIVNRRFEQVFYAVDGGADEFVYQVLGPNDSASITNVRRALEGYFWFDTDNLRLHVVPREGVSLTAANVETRLSSRKRLFHFFRSGIGGGADTPVVMRNLIWEHSGSVAVFFQNVKNVRVEDCIFRLNKEHGFALSDGGGDGQATVRNTIFEDNGVYGFGSNISNSLFEDLIVRRNARAAAVANYFGWAQCGFKVADADNMVMRRIESHDNHGLGVWLDTGLRNFLLADVRSYNNASAGIFIENNNRNNVSNLGSNLTVWVRNSIFERNRDRIGSQNGRGVQITENENSLITNSVIAENDVFTIRISENNRGPNWDNQWAGSIIAGLTDDPRLIEPLILEGSAGAARWTEIYNSWDGTTNDNIYFDPREAPFPGRMLQALTLEQWRIAPSSSPDWVGKDPNFESRSQHIRSRWDGRPLIGLEGRVVRVRSGEGPVAALDVLRLGVDTSEDLTVHLRLRESYPALAAGDLVGELPSSVVIPAGTHRKTVYLEVNEGGLAEGAKSLIFNVEPNDAYYVTIAEATIRLEGEAASELPAVNLAWLDPIVAEGETAVLRLLRSGGDVDDALAVNLDWSGEGSGSLSPTATYTIPAGISFVDVPVILDTDDAPNALRQIRARLAFAGTPAYVAGTEAEAILSIRDRDRFHPREVAAALPQGPGSVTRTVSVTNPEAFAQTLTLDRPPANYEWTDTRDPEGDVTFAWEDFSTRGSSVTWSWFNVNQNGITQPINLPFAFRYFGETYNQVYLHSNGFITFAPESNGAYISPVTLPTTSPSSMPAMIAAFWRNLGLDNESSVRHGPGDDGAYVIQCTNFAGAPFIGTRLRVTFQFRLYPDGDIVIQYNRNEIGPVPLVGLQSPDKAVGLTIARNENYVEAGLAVRFRPPPAWLSSRQTTVTLAPGETREMKIELDPRVGVGTYTETLLWRSNAGAAHNLFLDAAFTVVEADAVAFFGELESAGPDWMGSADWGLLHVDHFPWVYAASLGWLYAYPQAPESDGRLVYSAAADGEWWYILPRARLVNRLSTGEWAFARLVGPALELTDRPSQP